MKIKPFHFEKSYRCYGESNGTHVKRLDLILHSYRYNLLLYYIAFGRCPLYNCCLCGTALFLRQTCARPRRCVQCKTICLRFIFMTELISVTCNNIIILGYTENPSDTHLSQLTRITIISRIGTRFFSKANGFKVLTRSLFFFVYYYYYYY